MASFLATRKLNNPVNVGLGPARSRRERRAYLCPQHFGCFSVLAITIGLAATLVASKAWAGFGQPSPWQTGLQESGTTVMNALTSFNSMLTGIITAIAGFVLVLLVVVMLRFNRHTHPTPSRRTGNVFVEVAWTVVPAGIVLFIALPSFSLLVFQQDIPQADLTVKATGRQWLWSYSYPDSSFQFSSSMLSDQARKPGQPRLLAVDNDMVVPVNKVVRVQVTGADVIHSFAVPSFGIKIDAIPGRLNQTWFKATNEGTYYGQCSELCGMNHAFMPIAIRVVSEEEFRAWLEKAKQQYAPSGGAEPTASNYAEAVTPPANTNDRIAD